jgi:hypothetical protein
VHILGAVAVAPDAEKFAMKLTIGRKIAKNARNVAKRAAASTVGMAAPA